MRVIVSGGGTGGHIYPALAIAEGLRSRVAAEILYVGTEKGLESKVVPQRGIAFDTLEISALDRSSVSKAIKAVAGIPASLNAAGQIIRRFKPDLIVGTGGYVSFPMLMAGARAGINTAIHEQNAIPGIANRVLARRVDLVMLTFPEAGERINCRRKIHTGLPVRQEILSVNADEAGRRLEIAPPAFVLLVFGGSMGAASINRAMLEVLPLVKDEKIHILWVCGKNNYDELSARLETLNLRDGQYKLQLFPYIYHMEDVLAVADLAICRAGASTVSELQVSGLPAIMIPYPHAAENHQFQNAMALVRQQAAVVVRDEELNAHVLYEQIKRLIKQPEQLRLMSENMKQMARPDALDSIIELLLTL
ncbi:MAG: undecaprenyldiphospho-muramoylpentapeptide beta-N-acetylglucosaminyltransferase [Syntrophomonadaceae bacterium]|nr:undecaprenyldiphospho-muramoylpentapeptide beta-N-acetylglucosaminyltransferase [Syntrophomonadaceae bacterium]